MALSVKHTKVDSIPDGADPNQVQPSDWNAEHTLTGFGGAALLNVGTTAGTVAAGDDPRLVTAADATLIGLAALTATAGFVVQTAANTFTTRTLTGTSPINVSNGGGVGADPAVSWDFTTSNIWTGLQTIRFNGAALIIDSPAGNPALAVRGVAGTARQLALTTGVNSRWVLLADTTAEGGSNAGSNFAITAYDDASALLGTALSIVRATRAVTAPVSLTSPILNASTILQIGGVDITTLYQPKDATLTALAALDTGVGFVVQTAADTFLKRSLVPGVGISMNQPSGTSGNPTIAIDLAASPVWTGAHTITTTGTTSLFSLISTDDVLTTSVAPNMRIYRNSPTPVNGDVLGGVSFNGNNASGTETAYASVCATVVDTTAGAEDGTLNLRSMVAGSLFTRFFVSQGMWFNGLSDPGSGVINANGFWIAGTNILDRNNTWTATQSINCASAAFSVSASSSNATLYIMGGAGTTRSLRFYTDVTSRWQIGVDTVAESGSNAGSNFSIVAISDAGSAIFTPLSITRSTGVVTFNNGQGLVVGAASGGAKGVGTINAVGVYDDNVLLTCYVLEAYREQAIDKQKWDSYVPPTVIPPVVHEDAEGKVVQQQAAREIPGVHRPARTFADERMAALNVDAYIAQWKTTGILPGMPTPEEWAAADNKMGMGEVVQRMWETLELFAVHIDQINAKAQT